MRTFDVIGAITVAAWLIFTGAYVWEHEVSSDNAASSPASSPDPDQQVALQEGHTWLVMRRGDEDIGFIHQTRTRLTDGWLVEYDMLAILEVLQRTLALQTDIKARLNAEAYLQQFNAQLKVAGQTIRATGEVRDADHVELTVDIGDSIRRRSIDIGRRPRLASNAVQQLLGQPDLQPGDAFEQSYFDATSMGMTSIRMEYVGRETIEVFGRTHQARHIRQKVAGRSLDVYVDADGQILIQEFPLKIVGSRVGPELGRARAASLRKKARRLDTELPAGLLSNLDGVLGMMGFGGGAGGLPDLPEPARDMLQTPDAGTADTASDTEPH